VPVAVLDSHTTLHPSGVRAQLHQVATRLEAELGAEDTAGVGGCPRDWDALPRPDMPLTVGLDGGYVHSCTQTSRKDGWFEVIAGKSMPTDGEAKCFAFVQKIETKPRRRLFEVLAAQGMAANQSVTFLTDGGEDIRDLPLYLYPQAEHYLDWFHITMRLTVMTNTAKSLPPLPTAGQEQAEGCVDRDQVAKDLERLKWLLWHGNTFRADRCWPGSKTTFTAKTREKRNASSPSTWPSSPDTSGPTPRGSPTTVSAAGVGRPSRQRSWSPR
jgi:hypothetical protein